MRTKRIFGDNPVTRKTSGTSHILTTPERIVREHRRAIVMKGLSPHAARQALLAEAAAEIKRPGNQEFSLKMISLGCGMALVLVGIYMLIWIVIPFLRMLRWQ